MESYCTQKDSQKNAPSQSCFNYVSFIIKSSFNQPEIMILESPPPCNNSREFKLPFRVISCPYKHRVVWLAGWNPTHFDTIKSCQPRIRSGGFSRSFAPPPLCQLMVNEKKRRDRREVICNNKQYICPPSHTVSLKQIHYRCGGMMRMIFHRLSSHRRRLPLNRIPFDCLPRFPKRMKSYIIIPTSL